MPWWVMGPDMICAMADVSDVEAACELVRAACARYRGRLPERLHEPADTIEYGDLRSIRSELHQAEGRSLDPSTQYVLDRLVAGLDLVAQRLDASGDPGDGRVPDYHLIVTKVVESAIREALRSLRQR